MAAIFFAESILQKVHLVKLKFKMLVTIKFMKKTLLLLLVLACPTLYATHYLGGEITWRCFETGPNAGKFKFHVVLYNECGTGSTTTVLNPIVLSTNAPGGSISCSMIGSAIDISPNCWDANQEVGCNQVGLGQGAVQERHYESGYITLNGVPPPGGWSFTFTDCCRPSNTNLTSSSNSYTLRAYMFPYSINGVAQNTNTCYDSSPRFLEAPQTVICSGYEYTYMHTSFDKDLDSVVYNWAHPQTTSNGTNAVFTSGYAFNSPFPNSGNNINLNQQTGAINFTPSAGGSFTSCVEVNSYRCNQKIASIYRDVPLIINTSCNLNTPPAVQLSSYPNFPLFTPVVGWGDTLYWETTVYAGQEVKFDLFAQDAQLLPNFLPQTIEFSGSSGQLGVPLNSSNSGCLNPPCATVIPKSPQTSYTSPLNNEITFDWQTDCNHMAAQSNSCGSPSNRYAFALRMKDNFCVAPGINVTAVVINVVSTIPVPPDLSQSCVSKDSSGSLTVHWSIPTDTGMNFDGYVLYRGGSTALPFMALDTIWNYGDQFYTDINPLNGANYYYMRTLGGCGYASASSDTIRLMELSVTQIPPTNSSDAQLNWNSPTPSFAPTFEIWRRPYGTVAATWAQIATTTDTTYHDTVDICGQQIEYQVRINGDCNSTIDGGFFSDQTNTDSLFFTNTQVDYVNSVVTMSWSPSTSPDVITYYLVADDGNGYAVLDTLPSTIFSASIQPIPLTTTSFKVISVDSCGNQSSDLLMAPFVVSPCSPMILVDLPPIDTAYTVPGSKSLLLLTSNCVNTYLWQERANGSQIWQTLQNNSTYSGTTSNTLSISGVNSALNGNQYRCIVSGPFGVDTSNTTTVYVINNVGFDKEPNPVVALITPNPNTGLFLLVAHETLLGSNFYLTDGLGRQILDGTLNSTEMTFDLTGYPKGIYHIHIQTSTGYISKTIHKQ